MYIISNISTFPLASSMIFPAESLHVSFSVQGCVMPFSILCVPSCHPCLHHVRPCDISTEGLKKDAYSQKAVSYLDLWKKGNTYPINLSVRPYSPKLYITYMKLVLRWKTNLKCSAHRISIYIVCKMAIHFMGWNISDNIWHISLSWNSITTPLRGGGRQKCKLHFWGV